MNTEQAKNIVKQVILETLEEKKEIADNDQLIGSGSLLDSMKLVEVCLALEDISNEHDFEFDWTSDATMSKSRSMFRTVVSLAEEFARQSGE